jgi:hypothetical protein
MLPTMDKFTKMDSKSSEAPSSVFEDTEVNEVALVRKIDWHIVPILFAAYFLQFLDKVIVNVSPLLLHLS